MDRRKFIALAAKLSAGGWIAARSGLSFALDKSLPSGRFFIQLLGSGGAHPPIGLDPIVLSEISRRSVDPIDSGDPRIFFPAYKDSDLKGDSILGVGAKTLQPVLPDVSIVNGILMIPNQVDHSSNQNFMLSGKLNSSRPFVDQVKLQLGSPGETLDTGSSFGSGHVGIENFRRSAPASDLVPVFDAQSRVTPSNSDLKTMQSSFPEVVGKFQTFKSLEDQQMRQVSRDDDSWIPTAIAGFQSGLINSVAVGLSGSLDTHSNQESQIRTQSNHFATIARLVRILKSIQVNETTSLYDQTVFIYCTDFARTAAINSGGGTEHNPLANSTLIGGGGIAGGVKLGQSTVIRPPADKTQSLYHAMPLDFSTGKAIPYTDFENFLNGQMKGSAVDFVHPNDVYATIAAALGINPGSMEGSAGGRILPGLLKKA